MKIEELNDDNHSAQNSDGNGVDEKSAEIEANTDNQSSEEKIAMDSFYEKLIKLNESSGLSLVLVSTTTAFSLSVCICVCCVFSCMHAHIILKASVWVYQAQKINFVCIWFIPMEVICS